MGCLGTQMGRKEDKKGGKERRQKKQTNEQWGSQDREMATCKAERASRGEEVVDPRTLCKNENCRSSRV